MNLAKKFRISIYYKWCLKIWLHELAMTESDWFFIGLVKVKY